jgi:hypothetical protein
MTDTRPSPLFHYCSSESFLAILRTRQVRASALTLSNDTMEGKWIEKIISDLCAEERGLAEHRVELLNRVQRAAQVFMGLGFCLSEAGDLLSQWRGYADDGAGVSVGFYTEALAHKAQLEKVIYDEAQQKKALEQLMGRIKKHIADGALRSRIGISDSKEVERIDDAAGALNQTLLYATPLNYNFKNPAFSEEREWRLVFPTMTLSSDRIDFRAKGDRISAISDL